MRTLFFALVFLCAPCDAQIGKSTDLWSFVAPTEQQKSIVEIETVFDMPMVACGVVALIDGRKRVVTACHTTVKWTKDGQLTDTPVQLVVRFSDGSKAFAKAVTLSLAYDVAILECAVPDSVAAIPLATTPVKAGDTITVIAAGGFLPGADNVLRQWTARATIALTEHQVILDCPLIHGDSGGAALNANGELVGVASGGSMWLPKIKHELTGDEIPVTYPARFPSAKAIRETLARK